MNKIIRLETDGSCIEVGAVINENDEVEWVDAVSIGISNLGHTDGVSIILTLDEFYEFVSEMICYQSYLMKYDKKPDCLEG